MPGLVGEVQERGLAVAAPAAQAPREPKRVLSLLTVREPGVALEHIRHRDATGEARREGVNLRGAQLVELAASLLDQRGLAAFLSGLFDRRPPRARKRTGGSGRL